MFDHWQCVRVCLVCRRRRGPVWTIHAAFDSCVWSRGSDAEHQHLQRAGSQGDKHTDINTLVFHEVDVNIRVGYLNLWSVFHHCCNSSGLVCSRLFFVTFLWVQLLKVGNYFCLSKQRLQSCIQCTIFGWWYHDTIFSQDTIQRNVLHLHIFCNLCGIQSPWLDSFDWKFKALVNDTIYGSDWTESPACEYFTKWINNVMRKWVSFLLTVQSDNYKL